MAYKYFIYSTGTTFTSTIVRVSDTDNPSTNEASFYYDFIIPEIQPVYLWRVDNATTPTDIIPNTDGNIEAYIEYLTPTPSSDTLVTFGDLSGVTDQKIDKVTGATDNIPIFAADGSLLDGGYTIPELTGLTTYTFIGSGGTQVYTNGNQITIHSTTLTGTSVTWNDVTNKPSWLTGTTLQEFEEGHEHDQYALQTDFTGYTASTSQIIQGLEDDIDYISGVTSGLSGQISGKVDLALFTGFTATTEQDFIDVYDYIDSVSAVTTGNTADIQANLALFTGYTATTQPILDVALTGVTNLGTGTTLGSTSGRNVTLKSISVTGNLALLGDTDNIIISGGSGISSVNWGDIGGTLSGQTDLWSELTGLTAQIDTKLDIIAFTGYSATTDQRLQGIEADIQYISGVTSGITAELDTKLDTIVFTGYTATTQPILDAALTGATNGLTASGRNVELGGTLTKDTLISGLSYNFAVNTKQVTLQAIDGISIIDTDGGGGVNIESDAGTIALIGNTNLGVEKTKLEIDENIMLITDSRATQVGLQYAADYSTTFTDESLITKRYADAIAAGLVPKAAVRVATTAPITLSGLTTIDGIALANGDRVLVKNQSGTTAAIDNGIYVASAGTWTRATDFDDVPGIEVTSGNIIPVITGDTQYNTLWVLITPNPITIGTTPIEFTLFASPSSYVAGLGIGITGNTIYVNGSVLAGSSIVWSGGTFNVDPTTGTLASALAEKLDVTTFTGYTATTSQLIATKLDTSVFTGYTATTQPILDGAVTGATNGLTKTDRNVGLGGTLDANTTIDGANLYDLAITNIDEFQVSTDGLTGATFGVDTTGILLEFSGTSVELNSNAGLEYGADYSGNYTPRSLVDADFVTGLTSGLQADIDYVSGITDAHWWAFTGYTASTTPNEIFLIHTGGTDVNTITPTLITWHSAEVTGDAYSWTGGSNIQILEAGDYEINYNLPFNQTAGTSNVRGIGSNIVLNGATILDTTLAAASTSRLLVSSSLVLSTVVVTLAQNDILTLQTYRTGLAGTTNSVANGSIMIKKKNKLQ